MGFVEARIKQLPVPMAGPTGQAYQRAHGTIQDAELDKTKDGIDARLPLYAPTDAFPLLGKDRGILRAPIETDAAYQLRLAQAFDIRYWDGTKPGMQQIFAPYGVTAANCAVFDNCESDWDDNAAWYSRFFIVCNVVANSYFQTALTWNDAGTYDDGGLWDSTITQADVAYFRRSIRAFKAPASYPVVIAFWKAGDGLWNSPGTYDDGGNWDDTNTSTIFWVTVGHCWNEEAWLGTNDGPWDAPGVWLDFETP